MTPNGSVQNVSVFSIKKINEAIIVINRRKNAAAFNENEIEIDEIKRDAVDHCGYVKNEKSNQLRYLHNR